MQQIWTSLTASLVIGVTVLVDSKALITVLGSEMDFVQDKLSEHFVFNNPNAKGTCGCGESFTVVQLDFAATRKYHNKFNNLEKIKTNCIYSISFISSNKNILIYSKE